MKSTFQIFQAFLECNTKCWLISLGKKGKGNEYATWVKNRNDSYYSPGVKRLFERLPQRNALSHPWGIGELLAQRRREVARDAARPHHGKRDAYWS